MLWSLKRDPAGVAALGSRLSTTTRGVSSPRLALVQIGDDVHAVGLDARLVLQSLRNRADDRA